MNSPSISWRSARRLLLKVALPSLAVLALVAMIQRLQPQR